MDQSKETFERGPALGEMASALPAATYNLTRILLANSPRDCVFVPIRAMQYQAVIDREEIIFVDSQYRRWVEVAWRQFQPRERAALDEPVAYQAVFYTAEGRDLQRRLQAEFHKALSLLDSRRPAPGEARILNLRGN
ncbi:MAG TPA: hypothetical protein PLQ64_12720 [Thiobacillaceae bacterium]|nr:hypothetical protein [Thiobacillaceae bacterium]HNI08061.1 hypothetical protein [Thiobacillaceae bacterium]